MSHQFHIPQQNMYPVEQPGQVMYTVSPGRPPVNASVVYTGAPSMRPSSTMVDENGEPVQFYPAMSARPSMVHPYSASSTRASFSPQSHAVPDFSGEPTYMVGNVQSGMGDRYVQVHHNPEARSEPARANAFTMTMAPQGVNAVDLPGPAPAAPHLWSQVIPQSHQPQKPEARRPSASASPAAPGTVSPALHRLLHLQQAGSRRSSASQEAPSAEKLLVEAEDFFTAMEVAEQELVDSLEAVHVTVDSSASADLDPQATNGQKKKRLSDPGGAELSASFSCASVATSVGAGGVREESAASKALGGGSSQERVKQDLAFCTRIVETTENVGATLRALDTTNRRIQQFFLVDKYHGNKQSFFQRLHRRVEATRSPRGSQHPSLSAPRLSAREADMQAREDAVCDRLLADILMQRHFVPSSGGGDETSTRTLDEVRMNTPHTELRMVRFRPTNAGPSVAEEDEEIPLLLITVPARSVAAFEASKATESGHTGSTPSTTQADVTALTTPARYTQMQLLESVSERLETMRQRVGALEQRRATELRDIEAQLRELDGYDPSADQLHARRERIRHEMGLFQGWLDDMATLKARLLAVEQDLFQSVLETREIRRQLLLVLEQRLQEDTGRVDDDADGDEEEAQDGSKTDQVRFSHASQPSGRGSTTGDSTVPDRRSTQRPQLPRASTVFLSMLQRISDEQKAHLPPPMPESILSSPTERASTSDTPRDPSSSTVLSPDNALRPTAPPTAAPASEPTTVTGPVSPPLALNVTVDAARTAGPAAHHAGRRRGRDEMEAETVVTTGADETANKTEDTRSPRSSSVVSVSSPSENGEQVEYEDPLPFALVNDEEDAFSASRDLNQVEYSLRSGKLLSGVTAFVKSVVKRAVTFSDTDSDDDDALESRPVKRHRAE